MKTYNWERLLELIEAERFKYKADMIQSKDWEVGRIAIVIINALNNEKRHIKEIIQAKND